MARDLSYLRDTFGSTKLLFGITVEQLILVLYPLALIPVAYLWYSDLRRRRLSVSKPVGCTKLGMKGPSNVQDQYEKKYDVGTKDQSQWKIKAIHVHPLKSCAPIELDVADVDPEGMLWDRIFCIAELMKPVTKLDASEEEKRPRWIFRTLRQPKYEKLAHVQPEVWIPNSTAGKDSNSLRRVEKEGALIVRYPNVPTGPLAALDRLMISLGFMSKTKAFSMPLLPPQNHDYPIEKVNVIADDPHWLNYKRHVPDDFGRWIGVENPVTIFRVDPKAYREVYKNAPTREEVGYQTVIAAQDDYPVHLLNIASVHDLGSKLKESIPKFSVRRYRSNILVEGVPVYDEDDWKKIKIGGHELYSVCHAIRCRLPNVDPDTAIRHPAEPDKTMRATRCIDPGDPKKACMGMQLVPAKNERVQIRVGDVVKVLERGHHHAIL